MMRKEIVMKMLLEKLKAAFGGAGHPSYRISIDAKTDIINVADSDYEYESVVFKATYDEAFDSFYYTGDNIDSSILRALVEIEDAIAEEYPYPEETVVYEVFMNSKDYPDTYDMWGMYLTIEKAIATMHELKRKNPNIEYYIQKKTIIKERVMV